MSAEPDAVMDQSLTVSPLVFPARQIPKHTDRNELADHKAHVGP